MYDYKQNPILQNEISIYKDDILVATINKANFDTDQEAFDFAEFMCDSMNTNI